MRHLLILIITASALLSGCIVHPHHRTVIHEPAPVVYSEPVAIAEPVPTPVYAAPPVYQAPPVYVSPPVVVETYAVPYRRSCGPRRYHRGHYRHHRPYGYHRHQHHHSGFSFSFHKR